MNRRTTLGLGTALVLLVVACGGSVSGLDGSSSGASGGTSGSSGSSGSSSGASGASGSRCTTAALAGDRACVPGTAMANVPIQIAVGATEGCLGCFAEFDPCRVSVNGSRITVAMVTTSCPPTGNVACPPVCQLAETTCTLPPLAAGTYVIDVAGELPGEPPRELVVTADATKTSCKLPLASELPRPLDGSVYAKSCSSNDDCTLVTGGDVCSPCRCPNLAIAKSSSGAYESDYRERISSCKRGAPVQCAACAPTKAACEIPPDALTGTCVLKTATP